MKTSEPQNQKPNTLLNAGATGLVGRNFTVHLLMGHAGELKDADTVKPVRAMRHWGGL